MAKNISMDLQEYQNELNGARQNGFVSAMDMISNLIQSKKNALEFYGEKSLNPAIPEHAQIIRYLSLSGQGEYISKLLMETPCTPPPVEQPATTSTTETPATPDQTQPSEEAPHA